MSFQSHFETREAIRYRIMKGEFRTQEHEGRSKVWESFLMVTYLDGTPMSYVCCKLCGDVFTYKGHCSGTSTLKKHVVKCSKIRRSEGDESDNSEGARKYKGKQVLKKWTQVRDSYRKSICKTKSKSGGGATKAKAYIYASQLQFLDKIFEERETEDTLSQNIDDNDSSVADVTVENDENPMQSVPSVPRDAALAEEPESSFKKPASKKQIAALKEIPNRHFSFFKGLLPSIEDFDEFDTLDFKMEVLKAVKKIRHRQRLLPSTSNTPYAFLPSTSPMTSQSSIPLLVSNRYIHRQPNPLHNANGSIYQKPIQSLVPTVDFSSNGGEKETINEGEDRKMDLSSLVAGNMNENSMGSVGDNPGTSNDCPIPSPEQYLTEEMDQQPTPSNIQVQRPESYKLRHNNHLSLVLESLAGDESFMDVTLTAQGKAIKAHKSVLSAVSPYFKSVLKENPCQHPIIIMPRDIRFGELNNIISYVYKGEMTVAAEDLPSLLRTAEILQVTGLTPSDSSAMSGTSSSILGQIRGATAAAAANSNMSTSCSSPSPSPAKTVNKKSARYHSTPKLKEVPQSSSYDNEMSDKIDPLDYLNPDMACVKEELSSDDEKNYEASTETAEDVQFPTQIPQDLPVDSSYNSKKGCPLSKKRKASTETSSLHDDPDEDAGNHSDSLTDECLINQTALFVCPYCFESHRPTEVLQTHLRLKHPSKPSFLCKCGKVFVRQALFEQHKKSCDKL